MQQWCWLGEMEHPKPLGTREDPLAGAAKAINGIQSKKQYSSTIDKEASTKTSLAPLPIPPSRRLGSMRAASRRAKELVVRGDKWNNPSGTPFEVRLYLLGFCCVEAFAFLLPCLSFPSCTHGDFSIPSRGCGD